MDRIINSRSPDFLNDADPAVGHVCASMAGISARAGRGGRIVASAAQARGPARPRNTHRWTDRELQAEKGRLVAWLKDRKEKGLGVPSSRARPESPFTSLIAKEAKVRRSAISLETGHLKKTLNEYVEHIKLKPYDGPAGVHFERSDRVYGDLVSFIKSREAAGLGLPSTNGRPNMAAIAHGAGICSSTLTDKSHRNHRLVTQEFALMGGNTEDPKREGPLVLAELLKELETA